MNIYVVGAAAAIFIIAGCTSEVSTSIQSGSTSVEATKIEDKTKLYDVICLDGIQYWSRGWSLAPRIDSLSRKPVRCSE